MRRTAVLFVLAVAGTAAPCRSSAIPVEMSALTVDEAVAVALDGSRELVQARDDVARADSRIVEARSGALPQVNGAWNMERNLKPNVFVMSIPDSAGVMHKNRLKIGTDYTSSFGVNLTQPLYVGGKVGAALTGARVYRRLAAQTERLVRQNVIYGTLQAFYGALLARELEGIAVAAVDQAERHLANVETRRRAGAATDFDLLRARVNAANLRPGLLEAQNRTRTALLRLTQVMGVDPATPVGVRGQLAPPDTSVLAAAAAADLTGRPDLVMAELGVKLQQQAVRIARGDFLPTLSASTTMAYNGNFDRLGYDRADWSTYWTAGLNLSVPIFSGLRSSAQYQQARLDLHRSQTEQLKARDGAAIDVQQAVMDLRQALAQMASGRLNVDEASRAVEIAEALYANGKATQLEVLDAQLALHAARTQLTQALYSGTVAEITLNKSLGRLDAAGNRKDNPR